MIAQSRIGAVSVKYSPLNNVKIIDKNYYNITLYTLRGETINNRFFVYLQYTIGSYNATNPISDELESLYAINAGLGFTLFKGKRLQFPLSSSFGITNLSLANDDFYRGINFEYKAGARFFITNSLAITASLDFSHLNFYSLNDDALDGNVDFNDGKFRCFWVGLLLAF
ncbi:MAG: hypothetical protein KDC90_05540 [Ignavibacteriae bacterium]|nr:hypothetical protein [Ignavibacteriota bacterium]